jgi:hypothetical protein
VPFVFDRVSGACAICDFPLANEAAAAPLPRRSILAVVIAREENLSRSGMARVLDCAHVYSSAGALVSAPA